MPKAYKKCQRRQARLIREENRRLRQRSISIESAEVPRKRRRETKREQQSPDNYATKAYRQKLRYWIADDQEESDVSTANEFIEPVSSEDYDRILLHHQVRKVDDLYLKKEQMDKIFASLQQSAKNQDILYLSSSEILSDAILPSIENVKFIVTPTFDREGNVLLAAFDLATRIPWRFFKPPLFKYQSFKTIKDALEMKLKARLGPDFKFESDKPPRDCDRIVVQRTDSYNDGILVCRAAEDIFFTGWMKLWDSFDINAERERFQRIYDIINNEWDGVWPERFDGDINSLDESDNSILEDDASSILDASNQASDVEEDVTAAIDDNQFIDFDDQQSPPPVSTDAEESLSHNLSSSILSSDSSLQPDYSPPSSPRRESNTYVIRNQQPKPNSVNENDLLDNDISGTLNNDLQKCVSSPSALGPYAAVFPRSPRSDHSRRHSFSRSPPLPKTSSTKSSSDTSINNFLLNDVSLSNIAAPFFDISGGSERGSLEYEEERNLSDRSPGLSNAQRVENIEQEDNESIEPTAAVLTQINELPLDRSVEATVKEIESIFIIMWPQIQNLRKVEDVDSLVAPVFNSEDPDQQYRDAYRRLIAASFISEIQSTVKKRLPFSTVQEFKKHITDALLRKLSIERKNDLLDARHVWVRKNPEFMKTVQARQDEQDFESQIVNDYKRELVCKAIAAEDIINYSNERANRFTDIGFNECVEFLRKHAPEQLDALLAQYDN